METNSVKAIRIFASNFVVPEELLFNYRISSQRSMLEEKTDALESQTSL